MTSQTGILIHTYMTSQAGILIHTYMTSQAGILIHTYMTSQAGFFNSLWGELKYPILSCLYKIPMCYHGYQF